MANLSQLTAFHENCNNIDGLRNNVVGDIIWLHMMSISIHQHIPVAPIGVLALPVAWQQGGFVVCVSFTPENTRVKAAETELVDQKPCTESPW